MITTSKATKLDGTVVTEYRGHHNDMKPVTGLTTGDIFYELDGDYIFRWNGTQWVQLVANDSEGGGGSDVVVVSLHVEESEEDPGYTISASHTPQQAANTILSGKFVVADINKPVVVGGVTYSTRYIVPLNYVNIVGISAGVIARYENTNLVLGDTPLNQWMLPD